MQEHSLILIIIESESYFLHNFLAIYFLFLFNSFPWIFHQALIGKVKVLKLITFALSFFRSTTIQGHAFNHDWLALSALLGNNPNIPSNVQFQVLYWNHHFAPIIAIKLSSLQCRFFSCWTVRTRWWTPSLPTRWSSLCTTSTSGRSSLALAPSLRRARMGLW